MKSVYIVAYLCVICLFFSCQNKQDVRGLENKITIVNSPTDILVDSLFENVRYVPLELNDSSLLDGNIKRICVHKGDIYVFDWSNGITVFDQCGKYKRKIQHVGNGPGEYAFMFNFDLNSRGDISIIERPSFIYTYSNDDHFVSKIDTKVAIQDIAYLNDSVLLIRGASHVKGYKVYVLDMNKEQIIHSYSPIGPRTLDWCMNDCFTTYKGKLLLNSYQDLNVYELNQDSLSVRYAVEVKGKMPSAGFWDRKIPDWQMAAEYESSSDVFHVPCFVESDNHVLLRYEGSQEESKGYAWVDKKTAASRVFKKIIWNEQFRWEPDFVYPLHEGDLVIVIPATTLLEQADETFRKQFPGLYEESNPVLMFATLK